MSTNRKQAIKTMQFGIESILSGLSQYASGYQQLFDTGLENDYVIGDYWEQVCRGAIGLLDGDTGSLDCAATSRELGLLLERFNPQTGDDRTEPLLVTDYPSVPKIPGSYTAIEFRDRQSISAEKALDHVNEIMPHSENPGVKLAFQKAKNSIENIGKKRLTDRQIELLNGVEVVDNVANYLGDHIPDWKALKTVMVALGGKWRSKVGFQFPDDCDAAETLRIAKETGEILDPKEADFYPTPDALADLVIQRSAIETDHTVIEPSAGQGSLIRAIERSFGITGESVPYIFCFEALPGNAEFLREFKVEKVICCDFLEILPSSLDPVDRIVANPPFSKSSDVRHVMHMYQFLKPGGILVSIMSAGVKYRNTKIHKEFRSFLADLNADIWDNPPGSFKDSGTMVETVMVRIRKPLI